MMENSIKKRIEYAYKNSNNEYLHVDFGMCDTIDGHEFSSQLVTYSQYKVDWLDSIIDTFGCKLIKEKHIITTIEIIEKV